MLASRAVLRKLPIPCLGRFCERVSPIIERPGLKSFEELPLASTVLSWNELVPPSMSVKPRHGKWDEFVEERCRVSNLRQRKFPSHHYAAEGLRPVLTPEVYGQENEPDEYGISLVDYCCFFNVIFTLLERLDNRIDFLICKAFCCDKNNSSCYHSLLHRIIAGHGPRPCPSLTYPQLIRAYPEATRLTRSDRGSTVVRDGGRLNMNSRLEHLRAEVIAVKNRSDWIPDPVPMGARVSAIVKPDPEVAEFVRDLVALAEYGILGGNKGLLIELRMVVEEWLDYLWMPGSRRSALWNVRLEGSVDDLHPWHMERPEDKSEPEERLANARNVLERAAKVAQAGGLPKWGLMELYEFEIPHAERLFRGAEEAFLRAKER